MLNILEDYYDLREFRKAKSDPEDQEGRSFDIVAAEFRIKEKESLTMPDFHPAPRKQACSARAADPAPRSAGNVKWKLKK